MKWLKINGYLFQITTSFLTQFKVWVKSLLTFLLFIFFVSFLYLSLLSFSQSLFLRSFSNHKCAFILDRFFQATTTSSDSTATQLDQHGLVASSVNHHTIDHQQQQHQQQQLHQHHQIDKHGNLMNSPKSEVL